jgi:outer membrane protein TolC
MKWMRFLVWVPASLLLFGQDTVHTPKPVPISLLDAIASGLSRHPQLEVQRAQILASAGAEKTAAADFDLLLGSSALQNRTATPQTAIMSQQLFGGNGVGTLVGNTSQYSLQTSKLFQDGITISPSASLLRTTDNSVLQEGGLNTSQLGLQITLPLMRGRGRDVVTARLRGAALDYDASVLDLNQTIAGLVLQISQSYWGLVAAKKRLQVASDSEERGRSLLAFTQALIDADQIPAAELNNAKANLADRTSTRVAAESDLTAASQQLSVSAGYSGADLTRGLDASDDFPPGDGIELMEYGPSVIEAWVSRIGASRADLMAARKRVEAADSRKVFAQDQLRPSLSFVGSAGYNGLNEGRQGYRFLASPFSSGVGLNVSGGFQYSFAPANSAARGQLDSSIAAIRAAQAQLHDLERNIASSITVSLEALRSSVLRLKTTKQSVESFERALEGEREKFKLGASSLTDVLVSEDRLTNALLKRVDAELGYAQTIVQFRFASGTLAPPSGPVQYIDADLFRKLPDIRQAR